ATGVFPRRMFGCCLSALTSLTTFRARQILAARSWTAGWRLLCRLGIECDLDGSRIHRACAARRHFLRGGLLLAHPQREATDLPPFVDRRMELARSALFRLCVHWKTDRVDSANFSRSMAFRRSRHSLLSRRAALCAEKTVAHGCVDRRRRTRPMVA